MQKEEFIKIIKDNEGLIYKVTKLYAPGKNDEEDLYQEIIYQLWKSFESFRSESKISTWIYRVALNTAITHLHKQKKKQYIPLDKKFLDYGDTADNTIDEQSRILFDTIKKLPEVERALILLYLEGKSYEEMAGITGFSATNVGTKLGRIKQKLKSLIT